MISYLKGILAAKGELPTGGAYWVVDVQGVGYQVLTSERGAAQAGPVESPIQVFTSLIVREDLMQLVGFLTREERELFEILSSASGVGVKVALAVMSALSVSEIAGAIVSGDHKRLTMAKGVGPKLAQKLTIELKDKLTQWRGSRFTGAMAQAAEGYQTLPDIPAIQEAETVLVSLGYSLHEVQTALLNLGKTIESAAAEDVLQQALKWLATNPVR